MTRGERSYYLLFGTYALAQFFIAPIYPLFLISRGLDLFQVNAVLATYLITAFVFEVPTGVVADAFGRRLSFVLGCVIRMTAYLLYARADGFAECLAYEFIDALGTTFVSGALDAWAVDAVRAEGDHRPLERLFARASIIGRTLMIAGGIACGYVAELGFTLPWVIAAATFGTSAVLGALLMHEDGQPPRAPAGRADFLRTAREGLAVVSGAPVLLLLCGLSLATAFAAFPMHMLWQPRVRELAGGGLALMGWIVAGLNVASLAGSALLPWLGRRVSREVVLAAASLWRAATVAALAGATSLRPAIASLVLQEVAFGLSDPLKVAWTNEHVASAQRATVLSVRGAFITLGGAAGLVSIGLAARAFGLPVAFALSATIFAVITPGFLLLGRVAGRAAVAAPAPEPTTAATKVGPPALG